MASHQFTTTLTSIYGYDYSSGIWQFEGNFYVPNGSSGMSIAQVFGGSPLAITLIVNVIHDDGTCKLKVYINGILKHEASGRGGDQHFLKFGVHTEDSESDSMESRWSLIKLY
ncbi:hypothetical protein H5410_055345 [Solanum commersonii]|uniref:Uncharacterized protein n=1 Tax=Solanum commersonii TaxID=4109 RepID=A0A9J5WHB4_SOLCO|nr:hypothetical protein H5410_055345 [Solanum commersonii]